MPSSLIQLKQLRKDYDNDEVVTKVLRGVDLEIRSGEFVAIMGPSGSGKSTLMHIMGFLDRLTTGQYFFRDKDVSKLDEDELAMMRRSEVGFVFQTFNLLSKSTVLENVVLPLIYEGEPAGKRRTKALEVLESVGLTHRIDHLSNQLSGGERQRVAVARALVNEPSVIFADEPTGNLDTKSGVAVLRLLQELHEKNHTIVMVTHEEEAAEFAERIIRVRDGLVVSDSNGHVKRSNEYRK